MPRNRKNREVSSSSSTSSSSSPASFPYNKRKRSKQQLGDSEIRLSRLEKFVESLHSGEKSQLHQISFTPPPSTSSEVTVSKNIKYIAREDSVPEFCPEKLTTNARRWLVKFEQLANMHGWDDSGKIYIMQTRLRGLAKKWYEHLPNYSHTWQEWKELLIKAFPDNLDFATSLKKVINRIKLPNESMTNYYYNKIELLQACEISGRNAVSCLIDGLNNISLQNAAKAGRYETPEILFEQFLSTVSEEGQSERRVYKRFEPAVKTNYDRPEKNGRSHQFKQRATSQLIYKCYNCSEKGHIASKCPRPLKECKRCKRLGHESKDCTNKMLKVTVNNMDNRLYFVDCFINEIPTKGYIDSGCGAVTIREENAKALKIVFQPTAAVISGFAGGKICAMGEANVDIEVDSVKVNVKVLIVPNHVQSIPVIIGQPFLNDDSVIVVIKNKSLRILREHAADLPGIDEITPRKIPVWTKEAQVIPSNHVGYIQVAAVDGYEGMVYVDQVNRQWEGHSYTIPSCVIRLNEGIIPVANVSDFPLKLRKNQVLVRADECLESKEIDNVSTFLSQISYETITEADVNIADDTPVNIKDELMLLINEFRDCFAQSVHEIGKTDLTKMSIKLTTDKVVTFRPYRLPFDQRENVRQIVTELKDNDIIRDSNSPFASPILLVKKKTGEQRLCIDYRALNAITVKNKYPLPLIDDQIDQLSGNNLFTSLDMASGYYQVPMSEESIAKTAFVTPDGHYEFLRMPFGLVNAPSVFQRLVHNVLGNLRFSKALAYLDDILVPSTSYEEGLKYLREVFELFRKSRLTLRLKKCFFFQGQINYLGHEINCEGVRPDVNKIKAVEKFPVPKSVREVRQFMGLTSYFRKYIERFAIIAQPITKLTKKDFEFMWGDEQERAFTTLKSKLIDRPLLGLYNRNAITELHTDASKVGLGGILLQRQANGQLHPIAYYSRQTTKQEQRYHSYELEALAVVCALKRFRVYLLGSNFKVVTDCSALRTTFTKRDLVPRVGRWWLTLQEYDFNIEYRAGTKMAHVDALSRNPPVEERVDYDKVDMLNIKICEDDWVLVAQLQDDRIKYLHEVLSSEPNDREETSIHNDYKLINNRVFKNTANGLKWVVPKATRRYLVMNCHDQTGHFSVDKTLTVLQQNYWFPSMRHYVKRYIGSCLGCLYNKAPSGKRPGYLQSIEKVAIPMQTLHLDHLGPFVKSKKKNSYLIVGVDSFTKYVFMRAVPNTKTEFVIKFLKNDVISMFGVPERFITDKGTAFTSKKFTEYCKSLNVKLVHNATATPRANGQVERYNRTILATLAATSQDDERWDNEIDKVRWGLNTTVSKATGKSPFELVFGFVPRSVNDAFLVTEVATGQRDQDIDKTREKVRERLRKQQDYCKSRYDSKRAKPRTYIKGNVVLVRRVQASNEGSSKKLLPKYDGPFEISKVLDHDRYVVSDLKGSTRSQKKYTGIYPSDKLKHFRVATSSDSDDEVIVREKKQV